MSKDLFVNCWEKVKSTDFFLYIFIGGRGTGKTYSMLEGLVEDNNDPFIYMRRTSAEIKDCCTPEENPFKRLNADKGWQIDMETKEDKATIIDRANGNKLIGYGRALSTSGRIRGSDYSDVGYILWDEFINISPVNTMRDKEDGLLWNFIETVERNRELLGEKPIKVILLSNANTINDGIIRALRLGDIIRTMKINNEKVYTDNERGIYFELLDNTKLRDMKEKTRLYRLTKGTTFYEMSLNNEFTHDFFGDVSQVDYRELFPLVSYENITFYRHKAKSILYASRRKADCKKYTQLNKKAFKQDYGYMIGSAIERGMIVYQNYDVKLEVSNML